MSKTDRIESLKAKHAELEESLRREELRPIRTMRPVCGSSGKSSP